MNIILLLILLLILFGALPAWPHSRGWDTDRAASLGCCSLS